MTTGKWQGAKREQGAGWGGGRQEAGKTVPDLQRLRYGRREAWPEPRTVFRRAKQTRRAARRG